MAGPVLTVEESEAKVRGLEVERPEESDIVWTEERKRSIGTTVARVYRGSDTMKTWEVD
jgi:hypothetical protein